MSDRNAEILRQRARDLARPLATEGTPGTESILFRLAGERYAVDLADAVRILSVDQLAPLPGARPPVVGVTAWRGGLLPIVDLRLLSAGAGPGLSDLTRILVLADDHGAAGILAESVETIAELDSDSVRPIDDGAGERRHLRGVTPDAVLVVDVEGILDLVRGG